MYPAGHLIVSSLSLDLGDVAGDDSVRRTGSWRPGVLGSVGIWVGLMCPVRRVVCGTHGHGALITRRTWSPSGPSLPTGHLQDADLLARPGLSSAAGLDSATRPPIDTALL